MAYEAGRAAGHAAKILLGTLALNKGRKQFEQFRRPLDHFQVDQNNNEVGMKEGDGTNELGEEEVGCLGIPRSICEKNPTFRIRRRWYLKFEPTAVTQDLYTYQAPTVSGFTSALAVSNYYGLPWNSTAFYAGHNEQHMWLHMPKYRFVSQNIKFSNYMTHASNLGGTGVPVISNNSINGIPFFVFHESSKRLPPWMVVQTNAVGVWQALTHQDLSFNNADTQMWATWPWRLAFNGQAVESEPAVSVNSGLLPDMINNSKFCPNLMGVSEFKGPVDSMWRTQRCAGIYSYQNAAAATADDDYLGGLQGVDSMSSGPNGTAVTVQYEQNNILQKTNNQTNGAWIPGYINRMHEPLWFNQDVEVADYANDQWAIASADAYVASNPLTIQGNGARSNFPVHGHAKRNHEMDCFGILCCPPANDDGSLMKFFTTVIVDAEMIVEGDMNIDDYGTFQSNMAARDGTVGNRAFQNPRNFGINAAIYNLNTKLDANTPIWNTYKSNLIKKIHFQNNCLATGSQFDNGSSGQGWNWGIRQNVGDRMNSAVDLPIATPQRAAGTFGREEEEHTFAVPMKRKK